MAVFLDCLLQKAKDGLITKDDYVQVSDTYDALVTRGGESSDLYKAKQILDAFEYKLAKKSQQVAIHTAKVKDFKTKALGAVDKGIGIEEVAQSLTFDLPWVMQKHGFIFDSVEQRVNAWERRYGAMVSDVLKDIKPLHFGLMTNKEISDVIGKEVFLLEKGIKEGRNPDAGIRKAAETLDNFFQRTGKDFDAAGADIHVLRDYLSGAHTDTLAIRKVEKAKFVSDMIDRDIDWARAGRILESPLDTLEQRTDFLSQVHQSEATGGVLAIGEGSRPGLRNVANSRKASRMVFFNNFEDWDWYQRTYGKVDLFNLVHSHLQSSARDLGALETYGPKPESFKNEVASFLGKYHPEGEARLQELLKSDFRFMLGNQDAVMARRMKKFMTTIKAVQRFTLLNSTAVSALFGDIGATGTNARHMMGLPVWKASGEILRDLFTVNYKGYQEKKMLAARLGHTIEMFKNFGRENTLNGSSAGNSDVAVNALARITSSVFGNKSITEMTRYINSEQAFLSLAEAAKGSMERPRFVEFLGKHGITDKELALIKEHGLTDVHSEYSGDFQTVDLSKMWATGLPEVIQAANRAAGLSAHIIETVSPQSNLLVSKKIKEIKDQGAAGEFLGSAVQTFTGYAASVYHNHLKLYANNGTKMEKLARLSSFAIAATIMGVLQEQTMQLALGKDLAPITPELVLKGFGRGGVTGPMFNAIVNSGATFGGGFADNFFPIAGLFKDSLGLTAGNLIELAKGNKVKWGADLVKVLKDLTPGQSGWYTALLMKRLMFDQIQSAIDPDYNKTVRDQERRLKKDLGSEFFWKPGALSPDRSPKFKTALDVKR